MKNKMKFLKIILFFVVIFFSIYTFSNATTDVSSLVSKMNTVGDVSNADSKKGIGKIINILIGAMQRVGTGISVIMVTSLGLKYVLASAQEKADVKKQAIPIVIGAVLLFSAVNIVKIIADYGAIIK